ncbi:hypothetical protein [Planctopirus hydrillae]|uniref:Uncharacterized protein n=1 Tax=Planctopirus hydrillae TaxID=1841610 RepID=A0A1C3EHE9_9PLAN|nr:hypothetical protein [Planctopirus hydrillae]ODA32666.1 hypothetical protein A6X21_20170 [Planctopirus hydrillae]
MLSFTFTEWFTRTSPARDATRLPNDRSQCWQMSLLSICFWMLTGSLVAPSTFAQESSVDVFAPPSATIVEAKTRQSLLNLKNPPADLEAIIAPLQEATDVDSRLLKVVQIAASADPEIGRLVAQCNQPTLTPDPARFPDPAQWSAMMSRSDLSPFLKSNLALYYGRFLVERQLYDEAQLELAAADAREVASPATLFFFRAVVAQALLDIENCRLALNQLLEKTQDAPLRYRSTAELIKADLDAFEAKSLGEVARLMADSRRRLDLGRAGEKVQGVQEKIITNLDELIKKIEQQMGGGGGGGGGEGGNSNESGGAAEDSSVKGATAPGESDKKKFSKDGAWGNLPEKQQAEARNIISRSFPPNYGRAIDAYSKKLANRPAKPSP